MQLNNKIYDVLKQIALIYLPAAGTLYVALALIWHFPDADAISKSVVAVDTFLGVILGISSVSYNKSDTKYDGALSLEDHPDGEGTAIRMTNLDANAVLTKPAITLKINNNATKVVDETPLPAAPSSAPDMTPPQQ